jgi:signal transduction histidine kinase
LVLLRTLCHELRSPVTTITSLVGALEDNPSMARRAELVRLAGEQAAHARDMLSQASAAAQGLGEAVSEPVQPLHRILASAVAVVPTDRLDLHATEAAQNWPVHPRRTRQVLMNLAGNAVRHGHAETVVGVRADVRRGRLRLRVTNSGAISHELTRALHRAAPPPGETGLGLWIVRELVSSLGGSVRVRRLRSDGVVLEVRLPRRH